MPAEKNMDIDAIKKAIKERKEHKLNALNIYYEHQKQAILIEEEKAYAKLADWIIKQYYSRIFIEHPILKKRKR